MLGRLSADPTLEPRDVIVMCPDIESFAPLVQATFGAGAEAEDGELRVRLADRALRQSNPLLGAVAALLELAGSRLTASAVLDFAGREPVRHRFRLDDDELAQIGRWTRDTGIRWGLDAAGRAPYDVPLQEGTWRAGLDRVLLGVAMDEAGARRFAGVLPLGAVEAVELAGRLAEFVERLDLAVAALSRTQSLGAWAQAIADGAAALTATPAREAWQVTELRRLLDEVADGVGDGGPPLTPPELRALLRDRLAGRPTRANFRTGHLTVCTMYPMRSVPHRVVCLLGLDDGAFPRKPPGDGDDVLLCRSADRRAGAPRRGPAAAARRAARRRAAPRDHVHRQRRAHEPPAPAGGAGRRAARRSRADGARRGCPAGARAARRAPPPPAVRPTELHPRTARRRPAVELRPQRLRRCAGAARSAGARRAVPRRPAPNRTRSPSSRLEDLIAFARDPVAAFLRRRLGIRLRESHDDLLDTLPVELDGLEQWGVGHRLLEAMLAGVDPAEACRAEIARGLLPPGQLGRPVLAALYPVAEAIAQLARREAGDAPARRLEVRVELADGRLLFGTGGTARGDVLLEATFARLRAGQRMEAWVRLLSATASDPARPLRAVTVGRGLGGDELCVARIRPLAEEAGGRRQRALAELERLVELFDRGRCEPLPLGPGAALAYAAAVHRGRDGRRRAADAWRWDGTTAEQRLVRGEMTLEELMAEAPALDEAGAGWAEEEASRFGRLARRLWDPLLELEALR